MTATDGLIDIRLYLEKVMENADQRAVVLAAVQDWQDGRIGMAGMRELLARLQNDGSLDQTQVSRIVATLESQVIDDVKTQPGIAAASDDTDPFVRTSVLVDNAVSDALDSADRLQVGTVLRDRFLLQERVSGGSMGIVYKALDRRLAEVDGVEPWVAIKVLSPRWSHDGDALRALKQEAAKGRCLSHPNIVRFLDLDRDDDVYFIVMEWVDGVSLAALLDAGDRQLSIDESLDIVSRIGDALDYAHRCGVVHADIKPGNVMMCPNNGVKLIDFGVARIRQQQAGGERFDPSVLRAATPAYSSMQVLTGDDPVPADDVFSLACLAYRLIAGHRVFGPRNAAEAAEAGVEPQQPANLSAHRWKVLRKALAHSRVSRYGSPLEFVRDLLADKADRPSGIVETLTVPGEAVEAHRFRQRRTRWPYVFVPVLLIAAVAVLYRPSLIDDTASAVERWLGAGTGPVRQDVGGNDATQPPVVEPADETNPARDVDDSAATITGAGSPETSMPAGADTPAPVPSKQSASTDDAAGRYQSHGEPLYPGALPASPPPPMPNDRAAVPAPAVDVPSSLVLAGPGMQQPRLDIAVDEGSGPLAIEVYRSFGLNEPLTVRIDEVGYSGNQSPGEAGQYTLSHNGIVSFESGQRQATLEIDVPDNADREPDRQVTLRLRDYYNADSGLGVIGLGLRDDDQRRFEANHAVNTVTFTASRIRVRERDPAVSIDVLRLNPDQSALTVPYTVESDTAVDGEDFFVPGRPLLRFGPGQRTARVLIPLVQDAKPESEETFYIKLETASEDADTFPRIAVMIVDDDSIN